MKLTIAANAPVTMTMTTIGTDLLRDVSILAQWLRIFQSYDSPLIEGEDGSLVPTSDLSTGRKCLATALAVV